jgi:hypothetical protein
VPGDRLAVRLKKALLKYKRPSMATTIGGHHGNFLLD